MEREKSREKRTANDKRQPDEPEIGFGSVESVAEPNPFSTLAAGLFDLVGSTASEISEILSPEDARKRELASVMKNREKGRER